MARTSGGLLQAWRTLTPCTWGLGLRRVPRDKRMGISKRRRPIRQHISMCLMTVGGTGSGLVQAGATATAVVPAGAAVGPLAATCVKHMCLAGAARVANSANTAATAATATAVAAAAAAALLTATSVGQKRVTVSLAVAVRHAA
eukprot:15436437-Alexandrium_andersonii.AAC.1